MALTLDFQLSDVYENKIKNITLPLRVLPRTLWHEVLVELAISNGCSGIRQNSLKNSRLEFWRIPLRFPRQPLKSGKSPLWKGRRLADGEGFLFKAKLRYLFG